MAFFPEFPNGSPKAKTFIVLKFWWLTFSSNQAYLKHTIEISYNFQKNISNGV
jgi:hypothetical protein